MNLVSRPLRLRQPLCATKHSVLAQRCSKHHLVRLVCPLESDLMLTNRIPSDYYVRRFSPFSTDPIFSWHFLRRRTICATRLYRSLATFGHPPEAWYAVSFLHRSITRFLIPTPSQ